ncbi:hypothetical protein [Maribacter ulvicola]|uniref:Auto-transporter adhesin head GIN domain-containing protein n=1 Tax=Maribacter ulvicola TaxID=228959 RepID=A0A1N6RIH5_9FLAO|nr:hypothetical protein [Maribacter ulvicola]SIQ28599.1 hypothetical protein SAMN05421797_1011295 [Maribacter ulvicola]
MKLKYTLLLILCCGLLINCAGETNEGFEISGDQIGKLSKESLARDIELIFAKDSVVQDTVKLKIGNGASKIRIFEKGAGNLLLTLTPNNDSIATIQNILINDDRFVTDKGISTMSTFKDIRENYPIKKIITSLNNVVVLLKDSDIYFTIDKKELPESLRYNANNKIEEVQIPDAAKVKYMMIGWD